MSKFSAYIDGLITGVDPIGTIQGHISKNRKFYSGYYADHYGIKCPDGIASFNLPMEQKDFGNMNIKPIRRNIDEQISKALGDVTGLCLNLLTYGIPQLVIKFDDFINYHIKKQYRDSYPQEFLENPQQFFEKYRLQNT